MASEPLSPDRLRDQSLGDLERVLLERELQAWHDRWLGRKGGLISALMKQVAAASPQERRALGQEANLLKTLLEAEYAKKKAAISKGESADAVDITLPGRAIAKGRRHPLVIVRDQIEQIFRAMGYAVVEGPEIEDEHHNFEALNIPADHPARDMQDTLFLSTPIAQKDFRLPATVLRTHTSPIQIRYMEAHQPPIRIIAPGKVYRRDSLDLTHTPMFHQVEGLVVDEGVTMGDLKGTLTHVTKEIFGKDARTLFRPTFFPYTEPSADVFVSCHSCGGSGCSVCKRTGWLEILGCGMVHPAVFEAVGYDPERYSGFAFGMGIERFAMLKYGVDDIRMFYENDLRFLEQFPH